MSLTWLIDALPAYAEDQKRNLATLAAETILSEQQKWGCFLASACTTGEAVTLAALDQEAQARLSVEARTAAKTSVSIIAMNAVYFRAVNLIGNQDYRKAPANLSMAALTHPAIDKIDFELWNLAVSAVIGCGACLNAHEAELRVHEVSIEKVRAALRIAAVVHATSTICRVEQIL